MTQATTTTTTPTTEAPAVPPVEREVVADMARRGLPLCGLLIVAGAVGWGAAGAVSAAAAVALVLVNFVAAAALLGWAAGVSSQALMGAALGGFVLRLGLLVVAITVLKGQSFVAWPPLAISLLVSHLGLLLWELRHVSATLAYPGVRPRP
ncbi:MAG: ATP synthase subunit I [Acidimicrobiales bacterium]